MPMVELAANTKNRLGEGPFWDEHRQCLWWVDILAAQLWQLESGSGTKRHWELPSPASLVTRMKHSDTLLLACKGGFYEFDPGSGAATKIAPLEENLPGNRPNDGKCDAQGRLWLGTMDDAETEDTGSLYRIEADYSPTKMLDGLGIPNTFAWSPDDKYFYFADSSRQTIWRFDYDPLNGEISNRQEFVSLKGSDIYPDGSTIDREGYLWNAQWNGWRLVRYAPDGSQDMVIDMPVACPTSCIFGGKDYKTLFITSARKGQSEEALSHQENAGAVFRLETAVGGVPDSGI